MRESQKLFLLLICILPNHQYFKYLALVLDWFKRDIMSNASEKVAEIYGFLDRSMLKHSNITSTDIIEFIECQWCIMDEEKY